MPKPIFAEKAICPFKNFMAAAEIGKFGFLHNGQNIELTRADIDDKFVATEWPGTITIKLYKNWFQYITGRPHMTRTTQLMFRNTYPDSRVFENTVIVKLTGHKIKYYDMVIQMTVLDANLQNRGKIIAGHQTQPDITADITNPTRLKLHCHVEIENETR